MSIGQQNSGFVQLPLKKMVFPLRQKISLRRLYDLAPQKYPAVRDFETQTVKRLIYFENAEQDIDPSMLQQVTWQTVKEYFIAQASHIGRIWLE